MLDIKQQKHFFFARTILVSRLICLDLTLIISCHGKWFKIFIFLVEAYQEFRVVHPLLVKLLTVWRCAINIFFNTFHSVIVLLSEFVQLKCLITPGIVRPDAFIWFFYVRKEELTCFLCWVEMVLTLEPMQYITRLLYMKPHTNRSHCNISYD